MFNIASVELDWKGLALKLETGMIARQADGAVKCSLGGTVVLCTVSASETLMSLMTFSLFQYIILKNHTQQVKYQGDSLKRRTSSRK